MTTYLLDLNPDELAAFLAERGEPPYRARQISSWIYRRLARSFEEMTDLPLGLRSRLSEEAIIGRLQPVRDLRSSDAHTRKWLLALPDGARIETVLMGYEKRSTACISTQAGCGMECVFCATGRMGLQRNLSAGEIVEQVLYVARELDLLEGGPGLSNIVIMGMGEPFANYSNTMKAVRCLIDPSRYGMGARHITISTVGLIPGIRQFSKEGIQVNLAISLHAATDDLRDRLVPINQTYPLDKLMRGVRDYLDRTRRRVSFEWALIGGVNDTVEQARELVQLVRGLLCHINLIPLNPVEGYAHSASPQRAVSAFRDVLDRAGIPNTVRLRRGIDIQAGCGQLFARSEIG